MQKKHSYPMMVSFLIFILLMLSISPLLGQDFDDFEPFFEEDDCPFPEIEGIICGYLVTLEDRSDPDNSGFVELAVAIVLSTSPNPAPDPIIYLEGGPGGAALLGIQSFLTLPLRQDRDIIVFDQRGTGFSWPSLNCPELEGESEDDDEADDLIAACRDRLLDQGVNLNAYNTAASAADIEDLRIALGYEQFNLYGISYGTRLALTYMRDFPHGARSAVIDSVYPPEIDDLGISRETQLGALNELFSQCAADAMCSRAYPNLEADFYRMIGEYNEEPAEVELTNEDAVIYGDDIMGALVQALYNSNVIPFLPYALDLLANPRDEQDIVDGYEILLGDYLPIELDDDDIGEDIASSEMVMAYIEEFGFIDDSEGMNYSFDCSEEYALNDIDAAFTKAELGPPELVEFFISSVVDPVSACEIWGVDPADPIEAERVISDIPTLIVSGSFDPITPPASGDSAALGLRNSVHLVFPSAGHGITFTDNNIAGDCAKTLTRIFFNTLDINLDASCIAETSAIDFFVED